MCESLMFNRLDELVADMVVDPDATRTQSEHSQRVLVIVSQRALADCTKRRKDKLSNINTYLIYN